MFCFAKFTEKQMCQGLFFIKVAGKRCSQKFRKIHKKTPLPESLFNKVSGLRPATVLKKRLWHRCFPVNFAKFLKTPFFTEQFSLQNSSGLLLLSLRSFQDFKWLKSKHYQIHISGSTNLSHRKGDLYVHSRTQ